MPWIRQIPIAEATGLLKRQFDAAMARAGAGLEHRPRDEPEPDAYVHAVVRDWRTAPLDEIDRALCELAVGSPDAPPAPLPPTSTPCAISAWTTWRSTTPSR